MTDLYLCIEILGEPTYHKALNQSGYSGRPYLFFYNKLTRTHLRAYRNVEDYRAERVDMHKAANFWPLIPNLLKAHEIEPQCWTTAAPSPVPAAADGSSGAVEALRAMPFSSLKKKAKDCGVAPDGLNKEALIEAILTAQSL